MPTWLCRFQLQYRYIQSYLLSNCNPTVEHSASWHLPAISGQFQDPPQQFPVHLSTGLRPVLLLSSALHYFYWKSLFIVCCTASSLYICLFTRGAILLVIESAPLSEDEDETRVAEFQQRQYRPLCQRRRRVSETTPPANILSLVHSTRTELNCSLEFANSRQGTRNEFLYKLKYSVKW